MSKLVQIIYISRSSVEPEKRGYGVDPVVARILAKSRANNRKNGLVGVLYFGDGCFFQCLEGEEAAVDRLYATLEQDPRHRDLKVLSRLAIAAPTFQDWSMKYVPVEQAMTALLRRHGMSVFDPYQFDAAATREVIGLLLAASDPTAGQNDAAASPPEQPAPRASAERPAQAGATVPGRLPAILAGVVALAAAGGLLALLR